MEFIEKIMELYPLQVEQFALVKSTQQELMYEVHTDKGTKIVKAVMKGQGQMTFLAEGYAHLEKNGLPLAPILRTKKGGLGIGKETIQCIVYDKMIGKELSYYDKGQMIEVSKFLGQFHQKSVGYIPSKTAKKRSGLNKLAKSYSWKIQELQGYQQMAYYQETDEFSHLFLQYAEEFVQRGRKALEFLATAHDDVETGAFCQQDFTLSRLTMIDGKILLKEPTTIIYDLPTRDIRIMLNKVMKKLSVWDAPLAIELLQAYHSSNPLPKKLYQILWQDIAFPHLFITIARQYYLQKNSSWSAEKYVYTLRNIIGTEQSKEPFLEDFSKIFTEIKEGGDSE